MHPNQLSVSVSTVRQLHEGPRRTLRAALGCDDLEWARGRAWAFAQAMGPVWYYAESNPTMSRLGRTTLGRISVAHVQVVVQGLVRGNGSR
jgi:hypothetical protein